MPGHVKKSEGPDPDPDPWLIVSDELKVKRNSKPYDAKKSCWVPDKATGGYDEGIIDSTDGNKVTVTLIETKAVSYIYLHYYSCILFLCSRVCNMLSLNNFYILNVLAKSLQGRAGWTSKSSKVRLQ